LIRINHETLLKAFYSSQNYSGFYFKLQNAWSSAAERVLFSYTRSYSLTFYMYTTTTTQLTPSRRRVCSIQFKVDPHVASPVSSSRWSKRLSVHCVALWFAFAPQRVRRLSAALRRISGLIEWRGAIQRDACCRPYLSRYTAHLCNTRGLTAT